MIGFFSTLVMLWVFLGQVINADHPSFRSGSFDCPANLSGGISARVGDVSQILAAKAHEIHGNYLRASHPLLQLVSE